jgi:hypothetical protein
MRLKLVLPGCACALLAACATSTPAPTYYQASTPDASAPIQVLSDTAVPGFGWPESVGCDAGHHVLYVSQFGGPKPNPPAKDGLGYISKVAPDGKVIEKRAFDVTMNKPKGLWIVGTRLWATDIDALWIFDTETRQSRRLELPGIQFANDVTVMNGAAYVSDNRSDQLFKIEPADYLDASVQPHVSVVWARKGVFPNGLWPAQDGSLLMVGFESADHHKAIYSMGADGTITELSQPIGRLDGLYQRPDGTLLVTDWDSGSVFRFGPKKEVQVLGKGFKGPADLCVMGDMLYVPDLVKGEVRILHLAN